MTKQGKLKQIQKNFKLFIVQKLLLITSAICLRATVLIHDKTIEIQRMSNRISKLNSRNLTLNKSNNELQRLLNNSMESRRILIEQRDDIDQQFTVLSSTNAQLNKENDQLREHIRLKEVSRLGKFQFHLFPIKNQPF